MRERFPALVIAPLLPEPPVTGGQKRTLRLLETMERAGLHPQILTADPGEPGVAARLRERGWTVEIVPEPEPTVADRLRQHALRLPSPRLRNVARRFAALAPAAALIQYEHTQSAYYPPPPGVPTVLSLHNLDSAAARSAVRERSGLARLRERNRAAGLRTVERRSFPRADRILCVTEADCAAVRAAGGRALLAPNGVDDDFYAVRTPPSGDVVLFFGHFGYAANAHGVERFAREGWPAVRAAHPHARFAIAGAGMADQLRARLTAIEGVDVLGLVADLPGVLAASRTVVVPIWEGGGTRLKVLEALATGRPVVSTALGASGIGFQDGRDGLLAETPETLAQAVNAVLDGREFTGRQLAEHFRWTETLSGASSYYAEVVARRRSAR
ncbi:MAG TPA: glycosyltransferase [Solirubrobacter sp.]|nr:glycosyltransferase [Solirubrobacter sp.]